MRKKVLFVFQKFQAFPCISTGIYGYPPQNAARVALKAVRQFLAKHHNEVDQVIFCLFHDNDVDIYEKLLQMYFPVSKTSNKS
jgi:O-acetyl-ADP-ribose deacetylase (regulator of RNase III)